MIPNHDRKMLTPVELAEKLGEKGIVELLKECQQRKVGKVK